MGLMPIYSLITGDTNELPIFFLAKDKEVTLTISKLFPNLFLLSLWE